MYALISVSLYCLHFIPVTQKYKIIASIALSTKTLFVWCLSCKFWAQKLYAELKNTQWEK